MVMGPAPGGWQAACLALIAIFLPGFLLVVGSLPFWSDLRANAAAQSALKGVNAAVVGLLLAALYNPIFVNAVFGAGDFAFALAAFALLQFARVPPWAVVMLGALAAEGLARLI
jgi:chromate transporter